MSHIAPPPPDRVTEPRRGRHRLVERLHYWTCLCGRQFGFDVDQLSTLLPTAAGLADFFGGWALESLPDQLLDLAEEAIEQHEAECPRRTAVA